MIERGTPMMYPVAWDTAKFDSVLMDSRGNIIAYVLERDDGTKVAIDMQIVEVLGDE